MKNILFFPNTIKQLDNNKTVEVAFNIEQMIPEFLVNEFGMENIINAIDELGITYSELTSIKECSSNYTNSYFNKFYDMIRIEFIKKLDKNGCVTSSYHKYTFYEFSLIQKGSELLTKLICDKFPYLSEFKTKKIISFDPYKFINGYNNLSSIPKEFRGYTVNELISMDGVQEKEIECTLFKIYETGLPNFDKYEIYLNCPDLINNHGDYESLYIPYKALKENDFSIIHDRTKSYIESYNQIGSKFNLDLKVLTCDTALKLKGLMQ